VTGHAGHLHPGDDLGQLVGLGHHVVERGVFQHHDELVATETGDKIPLDVAA